MSLWKKFDEKIKIKEQEIQDLEMKLREAKVYLQALIDASKLLPKEEDRNNRSTTESMLKPGSSMALTMALLKKAGRPLHITEILQALGKSVDKKSRVSLGASLGSYVRKKEIFTRPSPNTFGLISMGISEEVEPPEYFGLAKADGDAALHSLNKRILEEGSEP